MQGAQSCAGCSCTRIQLVRARKVALDFGFAFFFKWSYTKKKHIIFTRNFTLVFFPDFRSNCTNLQTAGGGDVDLRFLICLLCIFKTLHVNSNVQLTLFFPIVIFCVIFFAVLLKVAFLVCLSPV